MSTLSTIQAGTGWIRGERTNVVCQFRANPRGDSYTSLMRMAQVWLARLRAGAGSAAGFGGGSRRCCRNGFSLLAPQTAGLVRTPLWRPPNALPALKRRTRPLRQCLFGRGRRRRIQGGACRPLLPTVSSSAEKARQQASPPGQPPVTLPTFHIPIHEASL